MEGKHACEARDREEVDRTRWVLGAVPQKALDATKATWNAMLEQADTREGNWWLFPQ